MGIKETLKAELESSASFEFFAGAESNLEHCDAVYAGIMGEGDGIPGTAQAREKAIDNLAEKIIAAWALVEELKK